MSGPIVCLGDTMIRFESWYYESLKYFAKTSQMSILSVRCILVIIFPLKELPEKFRIFSDITLHEMAVGRIPTYVLYELEMF